MSAEPYRLFHGGDIEQRDRRIMAARGYPLTVIVKSYRTDIVGMRRKGKAKREVLRTQANDFLISAGEKIAPVRIDSGRSHVPLGGYRLYT